MPANLSNKLLASVRQHLELERLVGSVRALEDDVPQVAEALDAVRQGLGPNFAAHSPRAGDISYGDAPGHAVVPLRFLLLGLLGWCRFFLLSRFNYFWLGGCLLGRFSFLDWPSGRFLAPTLGLVVGEGVVAHSTLFTLPAGQDSLAVEEIGDGLGHLRTFVEPLDGTLFVDFDAGVHGVVEAYLGEARPLRATLKWVATIR